MAGKKGHGEETTAHGTGGYSETSAAAEHKPSVMEKIKGSLSPSYRSCLGC